MGVIKSECVHARTYDSREQAALEIFEYIECFYNRVRIHSAIGWMSPADYEAKMSEEAAKTALQPVNENGSDSAFSLISSSLATTATGRPVEMM